MWSGPRNISTAMMRAWGARADTAVVDEPLYAHYLKETGLDHPGRDEIIASHDPDWRSVVVRLTGAAPGGERIFYQKHMAHHLTPGMETDWIGRLRNAILIREPGSMLTSLAKVLPKVTVEETGLPQQVRLMELVREQSGERLPVVESRDVLETPAGVLSALCLALGVGYSEAMLSWEPGPRDTDGVWAKYWYGSVEASTGFAAHEPMPVDVPADLAGVLAECNDLYAKLEEWKINA